MRKVDNGEIVTSPLMVVRITNSDEVLDGWELMEAVGLLNVFISIVDQIADRHYGDTAEIQQFASLIAFDPKKSAEENACKAAIDVLLQMDANDFFRDDVNLGVAFKITQYYLGDVGFNKDGHNSLCQHTVVGRERRHIEAKAAECNQHTLMVGDNISDLFDDVSSRSTSRALFYRIAGEYWDTYRWTLVKESEADSTTSKSEDRLAVLSNTE